MHKPIKVEIVTDEQPNVFKTFSATDQFLRKAARNSTVAKPVTIPFVVTYDDGNQYKGKVTFTAPQHFGDVLAHHMMGTVKYYAGLAVNPYEGEEQYRAFLSLPEHAQNVQKFYDFFINYQIGDTASEDQVGQGRAGAIWELERFVEKRRELIRRQVYRAKKVLTNEPGHKAYLKGVVDCARFCKKHSDANEEEVLAALHDTNALPKYRKGVIMGIKSIFKHGRGREEE